MSTSVLITILLILLLILIPLLLSYIVYPDTKVTQHLPIQKKETKSPAISKDTPLSFEEIQRILTHKESSKEDLREAIEQLIKHHGKIHAKLGDLPHPDFKRYLALIIALCNNPQADKDIIVALDQKLRTKNPRYGLNIDEATNKGLAGRGF